MSDVHTFVLEQPSNRLLALACVRAAPEGFYVTVEAPTRTLAQNKKLHKLCDKLEKSGYEWQGKRRTKEQWKLLLISAHAIATKQQAEVVPGLEGEFVNLRESSARMTIERLSSLIEYTLAFCANHGVET